MIRYDVQDNDRLSDIARRHNLTTDQIVNANPWREPAMLASGELVFAELSCGDCLCLPADGAGCDVPSAGPADVVDLRGGGMLAGPTWLGAVNPNQITTGSYCGGPKLIQQGLNDLGYGPLAVDGILGTKSLAAMNAFGAQWGLGKLTWATPAFCTALKGALQAQQQPAPQPQPGGQQPGGQQPGGQQPGGSAGGMTPADACAGAGGLWYQNRCVFQNQVQPQPQPSTPAPETTSALTTKDISPTVVAVAVGAAVVLATGAVYLISRASSSSSKGKAA